MGENALLVMRFVSIVATSLGSTAMEGRETRRVEVSVIGKDVADA